MFQKRHMEELAVVIRDLAYRISEDARLAVAVRLCGMLAMNNPKFNRTKFLKACNVED